MNDSTSAPDPTAIDSSIAALQGQRALLGDAVVETALAALRAQQATRTAATPVEPASQQLRQLSVLFTDVVGSTQLAQQLDPEDINAVMDGALARFADLVRAHGGQVLQYAGDSMLAVFGTPVSHEDDAERAVRAGLAILAEGREQAAAVLARHGHEGFNVRVGIDTGGVLLGGGVDGDNSIRGLTVNTAARMEQTAPPGALRISQGTFRQVRGRFELLAQPPLLVKGRDEPMVTYLVQGLRAASERGSASGVDGVATQLIGRDAELAQLQRAYRRLCSEPVDADAGAGDQDEAPRPALGGVTVVGEAGMGKSRLAAEFRRWVDEQPRGAVWLQADASEQRINQPYGLLRALLASPTDLLDSDPAPLARSKWLAAAAPLLHDAADAALLGHLLGLDFSDHDGLRGLLVEARALRDRAFFHAAQWLRALVARGTPVIALLDDLHWADDGSLDFIEYLARTCLDVPLLVLGLTRATLAERRPDWASQLPPGPRIELAPLDAERSGELAAALLARLPILPAELRELLERQAEGNPFYMEELVNMLVDQGAIVVDQDDAEATDHAGPGGWLFRPERMQALKLPTTLVGVLQARLDALPAEERHTAQLASVVGFRFWDDSLLALGAPLPDALHRLLVRELVLRQEPSSLDGLREFTFRHHTLHQVTYESVLKRIKRGLHARVARWLVAQPGAVPLDLVAEHHERGGEPDLALGYWQRAAESAAARYANAQALAHAERALALAPADDLPRRYAMLGLRCRVLHLQNERERLLAETQALQSLAQGAGDAAQAVEALVWRARACYDSDVQQALDHAREAVARAPADAPASAARARALLAQCLSRLGRNAAAGSESAEALRLAREAGEAGDEGMILNDMGMRADDQGDHGAALDLYSQALARSREAGRRNSEGGTLSNIGYAALMLGDYDAACAQFEQARALFARIGQRSNEAITLINFAIARLNQQRPDDAQAQAQRALQMLRASGDRWGEGAALRVIGQAALALQDPAAAVTHLQASAELFDGLGLRHLALESMAGLASAALAVGDLELARAHVEAVLARQAEGLSLEGTEEPMRIHLCCYRVLSASEDERAAPLLAATYKALIERAERIGDAERRAVYLQAVPHHRELLAAWAARTGNSTA